MKSKKQTNGFTLIELMIALVVIGIGLAITVPAMRNFTNANRKAEQINKLVSDITYTKSETVTQGKSFCVKSNSGTATWDGGWKIVDKATNTMIRTSTTTTVAGETMASTGGSTQLCFRPDGSVSTAFAVEQCSACVNTLNQEKQLKVSVTGRISLNSQYACVPAAPACP